MKPVFRLAALAVLSAIAVLPASAQQAQRMSASNGLMVIGTAGGFEVLSRAGSGKAQYFCAAGQFAYLRLNAKNNDRVIVRYGLSPSEFASNRRAVGFALTGPGGGSWSAGVGGPRPGQNASVGHARALCDTTGVQGGATNLDN